MGWGLAIGGGLGLLQAGEQRKQNQLQNQIEAIKERYSPWTGQKGNWSAAPQGLGNVMAGLTTGAQVQKALNQPNSGVAPLGSQPVVTTAGGPMDAGLFRTNYSPWDQSGTMNT